MAQPTKINYQELYDSFTWDKPSHYNFATDVIDRWASQDEGKLAIFWIDDEDNEKTRTFSEISDYSKRLANALSSKNVRRGDVIILMLGREIEWWEAFTASLRMGAVISPGTTQLSAKDIEYRIKAASSTCIITNSANAEKIDQIESNCPSLQTKVLIDGEKKGWLGY